MHPLSNFRLYIIRPPYSACRIFILVKDRFTKMNASPSCTSHFISLVTMPPNE